jgi:SynChlorMet cassette protein ScmC
VHTALIERDGAGVLIVAAGTTGKSTCCSRIPPPWRALSDDEALIVADRTGEYVVHPLPTWSEHFWKESDRSWDIGQTARVTAILFLKQAPIDSIAPVERGIAALSLYKSAVDACGKYTTQMNRELTRKIKEKMLENVCHIANAVPAYELRASLTGSFWREIDKVIGRE